MKTETSNPAANPVPPTPQALASVSLLAAVAEYFDWLTNAEIAAEEMGNEQYRDAMARASSELGLMLIKYKIYEPEQAANDPSSATAKD